MATKNTSTNLANTRAAPAAASSFSVQQQLAAKIGGSQRDTHAVSPLDELLALKSLKEMGATTDDKKLWQGYINNSTRMLRLAAEAINRNPAIEEKLGVSGLQGVLALASLLKQRHADKVFDKIMDNAIGEGQGTQGTKARARAAEIGLETVDKRYAFVNTERTFLNS
jgi:hypothetical protein